jgi:type IV pilus assembly protein PilB
MSNKIPLGKLLLKLGYVSEEQIGIAVEIQAIRKKLLGEILTEQSFVSPKEVAKAIAQQSDKQYIDVAEFPISPDALRCIDRNMSKQLEILPLAIKEDGILMIAMSDPFDINTIDIISRRTGMRLEIVVSDKDTLLKRSEIMYYLLEKPIIEEIKSHIDKINATGQPVDIPKLLDNIMTHAIIERCTDVHISPEDNVSHVFFRIDGILRHQFACPKIMHPALVSRVKILSDLDISEQRVPQDGALSYQFFDENFDVRISTLPTSFGENVVMRILSKNLSLFSLEGLGFEPDMLASIVKQFERSQGIVLVTGPTGSGKTTTLYAGLRKVNSLQRRVLTAEDPIEYKFPFIKQTQINEKAGYTFATAMRAFLRQDPDVILLGEMRDETTAEMALRASITGHLVLSTLHTNDAVTSIPRLLDMNIKDYFIASALSAVIAQRLVRKVCNFCREDRDVPASHLIKMGFLKSMLNRLGISEKDTLTFSYGRGCEFCRKTGYSGRAVISELLVMDAELGDMIVRGQTPMAILEAARERGMCSMMEDGLLKSLSKLSNPEEIIRVVF